ncbi:MAG: hypothetical protein WBW55_13780 [Desulfobaccales bacterium]
MPTTTFEYCSLDYLNQWFSNDMGYCQALANGNKSEKLDALKSAGSFYKVARNLPSKYDEKKELERYAPVFEIIDPLRRDQFENDPVKQIREIEKRIAEKYGNKSLLSLTTKFLWIKIKQPILIYDSRAMDALGTESGDLEAYYKKWREEFKANQKEIVEVCSKLADMNKYALNQEVGTKKYIMEISNKTWFHERVFDNYLWNKGNLL